MRNLQVDPEARIGAEVATQPQDSPPIALATLGVVIYVATVELERRTSGSAHRSGMAQG